VLLGTENQEQRKLLMLAMEKGWRVTLQRSPEKEGDGYKVENLYVDILYKEEQFINTF